MANNLFTITLDTFHNPTVASTAPRETFQRLEHFFRRFRAGSYQGTNTISIRNVGVRASGTVTLTSTGGAVNDTVSLNGVALTAKQHNATATATCASVADNDTITVAGTVLTAKTTATTAVQWTRGGTDTADAAALVVCINANCTTVQATSAAGVVTIRAVTAGTAGNSITLVSSNGTRLAVTGSGTLANGAAPGTGEWEMTGSLTQQAVSLAAVLNASTNALVLNFATATSALGVVTITATAPGLIGNAFTLAKSGSNIAVSGSGRLAGGTETLTTFTYTAS